MALKPGTQFGSLDVVEPIGAGGMGEVYRATDTDLKRDVALKVLPQAFVEDSDRLARFQREAEILASLNHPNIAQVYGLEKAGGATAIVMELVEGPTLADRIKEGPIPPDEVMGIALQVAAALEAAHNKQIVHRDLKPANVKVRDDGTVKVLDFGISKPIDPTAVSGSPVMTTPAVTQTGVILGTAAYMSPEQARGRFVDERTDIWAFGCLLYEMLTGQPVFGGEDVMLTLARVLDRDADLKSIPQTISAPVRHTIKLCLEKDPNRRIADIRDVRLALSGVFESGEGSIVATPDGKSPVWKRALPYAAVAALVGAVAFIVGGRLEPPPEPEPKLVAKFIHELPEGMSFNRTARVVVAVSPTGDRIAYGANGALYVRELGELEATMIASTEGQAPRNPVFSPDGQWIAYSTNTDTLWRVSLSGGSPDRLTSLTRPTDGLSYTADGTAIIYDEESSIMRVPAAGGEPEVLVSVDAGSLHHPTLLPGGQYVLASLTSEEQASEADIVVLDTASGEMRTLFIGRRPRYIDPGYIVYFDAGNIIARAFDPSALDNPAREAFGGPVEMQRGVELLENWPAPQFELSASGTLVYIEATDRESGGGYGLAIVDEAGEPRALDVPARIYATPTVSPNGAYLAVDVRDTLGRDIWIYELEGQSEPRQLTSDGESMEPAWKDNDTILFASRREGSTSIYEQRIDGGGAARLTFPEDGTEHRAPAMAPDGRLVFTLDGSVSNLPDLYAMTLPDGDPQLLVGLPDAQFGVSFSQDGLAMAFTSTHGTDGTSPEVIAAPYPPDESFTRVSQQGVPSVRPVWSKREGSRRLSFQKATQVTIEAVDITFPGFAQMSRRDLTNYAGNPANLAAASIPGTDELVITWAPSLESRTPNSNTQGIYFGRLIVIQNFTELLESRVPPL